LAKIISAIQPQSTLESPEKQRRYWF